MENANSGQTVYFLFQGSFMEGLYIAASGGTKQLKKLDILSNNIANITTQAFKRDMLTLEAKSPPFSFPRWIDTAGSFNPPIFGADPVIAYVQATGSKTDFAQGPLISTENPLDVAIDGDGFFAIETEAGVRYTRNGTFHLDGLGQLVDREGNRVISRNEDPILIPINTERITIDQDGTVHGGSGLEIFQLGQLKIVRFDNNQGLVKEGEGMYINKGAVIQETELGDVKVLQGFIEQSNVNAVQVMIQMIETVRMLEAYQKIIQSIDEADDQSVNSLARIA